MVNTSKLSLRQFNWDALVLFAVTFWLSTSAFLDFLLMPMMYESGMMREPGFATAGYSLFWLFNRVELLCAATILTGLLVLRQRYSAENRQFGVVASGSRSRWAMTIGGLLFAIALTYTYALTPHMSALGLHLSGEIAEPVPASMNAMHALYWSLEALKLAAAGLLIKLCYRDMGAFFE